MVPEVMDKTGGLLSFRERFDVFGVYLLFLGVLAGGRAIWGEFLLQEMSRVPDFLAIAAWGFEIGGLISATYFLLAYCLFGMSSPVREKFWRREVLPILICFIVDCFFSWCVLNEEFHAYQQAEQGVGNVVEISRGEIGDTGTIRYAIKYEYRDSGGAEHSSQAWLSSKSSVALHSDLPLALAKELEPMKVPVSIDIRIDPRRPQRSWIEGVGWDRGDGITALITHGLLLQSFLLVLATLLAAKSEHRMAYVFYRFTPMGVTALWFLVMGLIRLLHGSTIDQVVQL